METRNLLKKIKEKAGVIGIVIIAAVMRILPHPPNFAPIGGLALFSGAHLSLKQAMAISLTTMFVSDLFLGFHATIPFVYGSFIAIVFIGSFLKKKRKTYYLLGASLAASILFFIVTNFGVWFVGTMYPKTISGLINAYALGIPFFRNTIIGDLVYTLSFFYGYRILSFVIPNLIGIHIAPRFREDDK